MLKLIEVYNKATTRESVIVVFFDIEKACNMMWKEGLLIKLNKIGVNGKMFNWIKDFLFGRKIQVRIGADSSDEYIMAHHKVTIIMINYVFRTVPEDIGMSLFADDWALWKKK